MTKLPKFWKKPPNFGKINSILLKTLQYGGIMPIRNDDLKFKKTQPNFEKKNTPVFMRMPKLDKSLPF